LLPLVEATELTTRLDYVAAHFFAFLRRWPKDSFRRESGVYSCCLAQYTASFTILASSRVFQSLH
jgi:hypothetical protein